MIHRMDPPVDPEWEPMPERLVPMMARPGDLPRDERGWSFEVKWDGVRAIAYLKPGRIRLESRNLREITDSYPEVRGITRDLGMREAVLDGEIVAFDEDGTPSFERLQRRMHVTSSSSVRKLAASTPVVYAIFDLLYLDGHSLMDAAVSRATAPRSKRCSSRGPAWRVPAAHAGAGAKLLEATGAQGLEGVVAKRLNSKYEPGRRSGAWVKVKHTRRQELVIGGLAAGRGPSQRQHRRAADGDVRGRASCATPAASAPASPSRRSPTSRSGSKPLRRDRLAVHRRARSFRARRSSSTRSWSLRSSSASGPPRA